MVNKIFYLFSLVLLSLNSQAANITVEVDRNPVSITESFMIFFEADDHISGSPDFSPLQQDFEILSRNQSESMKFINGNFSKKTRWRLRAMAKRSGTLTIPSIQFDNDNSPTINISVNKQSNTTNSAPANMEIFIETETDRQTVYVQQQVLYTIRFYRAVNISGASMSEPSFSNAEVVIEKLGDDASYETQRNGRRYIVIERKYALFPQQSGDITIEPVTLDAQVASPARSGFDPFGQNSTTKRLKSDNITLKVEPIPSNMRNQAWLPASDLQLTENWSQQADNFTVGEPVTRTLTLKADGLTAAQLPSLAMADMQGFKAYPDQPRLNDKLGNRGINGTRQEKIALIPTQAGKLTLPEIRINWWNVNTNKIESVTLPARTMQVQPSVSSVQTNPAAAISQPAAIVTETTTPAEILTVSHADSGFYSKLSILFGLGWLTTIIAWLISRSSNTANNTDNSTSKQLPKASLNAVKKACLGNNPQQSKTELLNWARRHWPDNPPANISEIGNRLNEATQQEIKHLNQALYGSASDNWQGSQLWQQLSVAEKTTTAKHRKKEDILVPLYP